MVWSATRFSSLSTKRVALHTAIFKCVLTRDLLTGAPPVNKAWWRIERVRGGFDSDCFFVVFRINRLVGTEVG